MTLKEIFEKFKEIDEGRKNIPKTPPSYSNLQNAKEDEHKEKENKTEKNNEIKFIQHYKKQFPEEKLTLLWVVGSVFVFAGAWFAGHLREGIGVSLTTYGLVALISFLFILLGSFMWIAVAVVISQEELEEEIEEDVKEDIKEENEEKKEL